MKAVDFLVGNPSEDWDDYQVRKDRDSEKWPNIRERQRELCGILLGRTSMSRQLDLANSISALH
jgi:hypothetical protein